MAVAYRMGRASPSLWQPIVLSSQIRRSMCRLRPGDRALVFAGAPSVHDLFRRRKAKNPVLCAKAIAEVDPLLRL